MFEYCSLTKNFVLNPQRSLFLRYKPLNREAFFLRSIDAQACLARRRMRPALINRVRCFSSATPKTKMQPKGKIISIVLEANYSKKFELPG